MWLSRLRGRPGVTVMQFPKADHLFIDGTGAPTPLEYDQPAHVDPGVIATIVAWVGHVDAAAGR